MPCTCSFPHLYLFKEVSVAAKMKKRARGICVSWCCKRVAVLGRTQCPTCRSRLHRLRNPDAYAYCNLRCSARKRGIGFELSFEDFQEFCAVTGYVELRGKNPESLTVDRIKSDQPYRIGNIRIMRYDDNVSHRYET